MKKYFANLEKLRHSTVTNMYGARPYLQRKFPEFANDPQRAWMDSYRTEGGNGK